MCLHFCGGSVAGANDERMAEQRTAVKVLNMKMDMEFEIMQGFFRVSMVFVSV